MSKKKKKVAKSTKLKKQRQEKVSAKTATKVVATETKTKLKPTRSKGRVSSDTIGASVPLLYGKKTFSFILAGIACIALGMLLMAGGSMPSPDVWDENIIYSFRRITLAPIMILIGLGLVLYAIFITKND